MKLELHDALCYGTFALDLLSTPSNPSSLFRTSSCRPAPASIFVPCLPNASSHNPLHSHIDHIALPSSQLPFCIGFRLKKSAMASTCFSFSSSLCCALKSTCMASSVVWFATDKCQMRNLAVFMLVGWGNCFMRFCSPRRKGKRPCIRIWSIPLHSTVLQLQLLVMSVADLDCFLLFLYP